MKKLLEFIWFLAKMYHAKEEEFFEQVR